MIPLFWTNGVGTAFMRIECSTRIGGTINEFMYPLYPPKSRKDPRALSRIKNTAPLICLSGWLDPFVGMQFSFFQLNRKLVDGLPTSRRRVGDRPPDCSLIFANWRSR